MAREAIQCEFSAESNWDGTSPTAVNRDHATVLQQRRYQFNITGPHGVLEGDFGGLFSPASIKLVGVAYPSWDPETKARVISPGPPGTFRQELQLRPTMQYVVLYPGDKLAVLTKDGGRGPLMLSINELGEAEANAWGLQHGPFSMPSRFRIIRETGAPFLPNLTMTWIPVFTYDPSTALLVTNDSGNGMIPANALCQYPRFQGCYVSIRYAGHNNDGKLHLVDNLTRRSWTSDIGMVDVRWSKVQFVSHDDGIALEATPAAAGQIMVCDIEIALVHPGNRLSGRFVEST